MKTRTVERSKDIKKANTSAKSLALAGVSVALITAGAFIKIPTPLMPVTLQCAFCLLAGMLLGGKTGALCVVTYVAAGLAGLPVFTIGGGITYVLQPSFGFLIGFIFGAFVAGTLVRQIKSRRYLYLKIFICSLVALVSVYIIGLPYMYFMQNFYLGVKISFGKVFVMGCAVFLPTDIIWCALSSAITKKMLPRMDAGKLNRNTGEYRRIVAAESDETGIKDE